MGQEPRTPRGPVCSFSDSTAGSWAGRTCCLCIGCLSRPHISPLLSIAQVTPFGSCFAPYDASTVQDTRGKSLIMLRAPRGTTPRPAPCRTINGGTHWPQYRAYPVQLQICGSGSSTAPATDQTGPGKRDT